MDSHASRDFFSRTAPFPADLASYARVRNPLIARICVGPGPDEWECAEIKRAMQVKAAKINELRDLPSNSQERALAQRYVREALWTACDLILSVRSGSLEADPFDLALSVSKTDLREMFPLVGQWIHGRFSEGQLLRMRGALRIAAEDQMRRDRIYAANLDAAGLRRLQLAHEDMGRALLWCCAALVTG